jgi:hypothetical protein
MTKHDHEDSMSLGVLPGSVGAAHERTGDQL